MKLRKDDKGSPMWSGLATRCCGKVLMIAAIVLTSGAADNAWAGGVAMIVGGIRKTEPSDAASDRSVVLTFGSDSSVPLTRSLLPGANHGVRQRVLALAPIVAEIARANRLDEALLMAVIHVESAGNPSAISPKGATGLMQLMPATGAEYGAVDLFDARQNIAAGARFLSGLLNRFGSRDVALAAYNAGAGAVDRYGGSIPPYDETRRYVASVNGQYAQYAYALGVPVRVVAGADSVAENERAIVPAIWSAAVP